MNSGEGGGRSRYSEAELDTQRWPKADMPEDSAPEKVTWFNNRKRAVERYAKGDPINAIVKESGLQRQVIHDLFNRCMKCHKDGNVYGFRALIPNSNRKPYTRKDNNSLGPGSFGLFVRAYPKIDLQLRSAVFNYDDSLLSTNKISDQVYFEFFITLCRDGGVKESEYPFNTAYYGKRSFVEYLHELKASEEGLMAFSDKNARRHLRLGDSVTNSFYQITRPYQRVLFDGHSADATWIFYFTDDKGRIHEMTLERFWLLLTFDLYSGSVLGRSISIYAKENYNRVSVIRAINDTLYPSKQEVRPPKNFLGSDDKASYRLTSDESFNFPLIEEFAYDNAKANLSDDVKHTLSRIGIRTNAGPIALPETRAIIERLFRILEELGLRQVPGSLGVGSQDVRRETAEKEVKIYRVSFDILYYCIDKSIEWYNNRPRKGGFYQSPLQCLKNFYNNPKNIVLKVLHERRPEVERLGIRFVPTVRGNPKTGTRPYVQFLNEQYTNPTLLHAWDLVGKRLTCYLQEDAREAEAYDATGAGIGTLRITSSEWSSFYHTYEMRVLALKGKVSMIRPEKGRISPGLQVNMGLKGRKGSKKAARIVQAIQFADTYRVATKEVSEPVDFEPEADGISAGYGCKGFVLEVDHDDE